MTKQAPHTAKILATVSGVLTALILVAAFASPVFADWRLERALASNCESLELPADAEKNVLFDPESGVVEVEVAGPGERSRSVTLPYRPEGRFRGCSRDAVELLTRIEENQRRYVTDMCADMATIVSGEQPLPERDGKKASMEGAKQFVEKHCRQSADRDVR